MRPTSASVDVIARTLESMLGGRQVTRYKQDAEQYDVIVQVGAPTAQRPARHPATSACVRAGGDGAADQRGAGG